MQARAGEDPGIAQRQRQSGQLRRGDQTRCFGNVVEARHGWIEQDAIEQEVHHLHGNLVEHDGAEDLVDAEVGFQESRQPPIERSGQEAADQCAGNDEQVECARRLRHFGWNAQVAQHKRDGRASQSARDHLAFAADVDHAAAEGDRDADAHEQDGRGFYQGLGCRIFRADSALEHEAESRQRVGIQRDQQRGRHDQRQQQRDQHRREIDQPIQLRRQPCARRLIHPCHLSKTKTPIIVASATRETILPDR